MNPKVDEAFFKIAVWITAISGFLAFFLEPGTPSFIINVASLLVGIALMGVITLSIRLRSIGADKDSNL